MPGLCFPHRPHPGGRPALFQTDPDFVCHATGCCRVHQPLHVVVAANGSEVNVVVSAVRLGLVPRRLYVYQVILVINV